jgi:aspartate aminotransferase
MPTYADVCSHTACTQGYASGDLERDAFAARYFVEERKIPILVTQSYSKNFGLYGERIGALNVVCSTSEQAGKVVSQLKGIVRPMYATC